MVRPNVVFGFLGITLDAGAGAKRWEKWRPTVALCQHEDFVVHKLVLLYAPSHAELAKVVEADVRHVSPETTVELRALAFSDPWDFEEVFAALHDLARKLTWRPEREEYLVHITTGTHVAQICLFLLTEARYFPAKLLQSAPPRRERNERMDGPGTFAIIDLDLSRYDRIASRFKAEADDGRSLLKAGIVTKSEAYNRTIERLERVASASRAPILLLGPTGAGKSQLAKRVYALKKERQKVEGPFVEVNCATIRGDGAMSALFGHVKGAFTGAVEARAGHLKRAHEGVLFLDEVGELGLDEQAMLLRAIEERVFYPVGSDREQRSDFQLLCGTNRDPFALVAEGRFREDLLARIDLWTFRLPALRERLVDLPPNLDYELAEASRKLGVNVTMSREARARYLDLAVSPEATWPGNFRDLNASVTRMATLAEGGRISTREVADEIEVLTALFAPRHAEGGKAGGAGASAKVLGREAARDLDRFDRVQLDDVLAVASASASLSEAGRALFSESRKQKAQSNDADRLRKYLARFDLTFAEVKERLGKGAPKG